MTTTIKTKPESESKNVGSQLLFDNVNEPGAYLSNWSGHLIRVPEEAIQPGHSPLVSIRGRDPMTVTKLSEDPYVCISKARLIAADLDLNVNF